MKLSLIAVAATAVIAPTGASAAAANPAAMHAFGHCAAERSPKDVTYLLDQDYRTPGYNQALKALAKSQARCPGAATAAGGAVFAGILAEELLEYGRTPKQVAAVIGKAPKKPMRSNDVDPAALCLVRANPGGTAQLLSTGYGSKEEGAAFKALAPAFNACLKGHKLNMGGTELRSFVALAAFRNFRAAGG